MILGADWLEDHSPMWIHWRKKKLRFPHHNKRVQLLGLSENNSKCTQIHARKLKGLLKNRLFPIVWSLWPGLPKSKLFFPLVTVQLHHCVRLMFRSWSSSTVIFFRNLLCYHLVDPVIITFLLFRVHNQLMLGPIDTTPCRKQRLRNKSEIC